MLRLTIQLFEEFEEELGAEKLGNPDELRDIGERIAKRTKTIATLLEILEKHNWEWTTGTRDIMLYKNTTKEEAQKEFVTLKIPKGIIEFD
ncbi:MAG: hypothetical protein WC254_05875 [Candidatus Woesearchaeota archaeon]|jgi:hypothetical protein